MKQNQEDRVQNEKIQSLREFLIEKFNHLEANISQKIATTNEKVACTDGKIVLMEEKSCRKHQEILATTNQYMGKLEKQIEYLKEKGITREQLDRMIVVNQTEISEHRKKIRELEIKQATSITKLSIVIATIVFAAVALVNFAIDAVRARFS